MKTIEELSGNTFLTCSACMSVWADGLSWANANLQKVTKDPTKADNVVVLACQVTDLAILNDIHVLEEYKKRFPEKNYFVSGCLGKREDITLPDFVQRLETPRKSYQFILDKTLVNFEKPFWIKNFSENESEFKQGHLFRYMYPLRIGKGCPNNCSYCTIRFTRGGFEQYEIGELEREFLNFDNILLIADSPTVKQVKEWYDVAKKNEKGFSIRNVEPSVTVACREELLDLAKSNLLKVYHSPVQSADREVLKDMHRNVDATFETMKIARQLRELGVYVATNIIIDYKNFEQDFSEVYQTYNYVSWNQLWDRVWNRQVAEQRFNNYLGEGAKTNKTLIKLKELENRYNHGRI